MRLSYENLVMATRPNDKATGREVLTGRKQRGLFRNYSVFPGGKEEGDELGDEAASREFCEETGIYIAPKKLTFVGRIIIADWRPDSKRFGAIELFHSHLPRNTLARITPELVPAWKDIDDPSLTDDMPPDVQIWWPHVKDFNPGRLAIHLSWYEEMNATAHPHIVVKEPGYGEVFFDNSPT